MTTPPPAGSEGESRLELHSRLCSCGGGSWILLGDASSAPCSKEGSRPGVVLTLSEWRTLGKPNSAESYAECASRAESGERREFDRYAARLQVRLTRMPTWRDKTAQGEETETEVIARGGALVRTRMAVEEGETLTFEVEGHYKTRAQVLYMSRASGPEGSYLRLGVRFLDELMPEGLIPFDAEKID